MNGMTNGGVRQIREVGAGVQAKVCVGTAGKYGYTWLEVLGTSTPVVYALRALRAALREEARDVLRCTRRDAQSRGEEVLGEDDDPIIYRAVVKVPVKSGRIVENVRDFYTFKEAREYAPPKGTLVAVDMIERLWVSQ